MHKGTLGFSRGRERGQGGGNACTEPELLCPQWFVQWFVTGVHVQNLKALIHYLIFSHHRSHQNYHQFVSLFNVSSARFFDHFQAERCNSGMLFPCSTVRNDRSPSAILGDMEWQRVASSIFLFTSKYFTDERLFSKLFMVSVFAIEYKSTI